MWFTRSVLLLLLLLLLLVTTRGLAGKVFLFQPKEFNAAERTGKHPAFHQWLVGQGDEVRRSRREVSSLVPGLLQMLQGLLANPGVAAVTGAAVGLADQALGFVQCCEPLRVPASVLDGAVQCAIQQLPGSRAPSSWCGDGNCSLKEAAHCTARCTFEKLQLLSETGVPSLARVEGVLAALNFTPAQRSALQGCRVTNPGAELTEPERCETVGALLSCMQRVTTQDCPGTVLRGMACLGKIGSGLLGVLTSTLEIKDGVVSQVRALAAALIAPPAPGP